MGGLICFGDANRPYLVAATSGDGYPICMAIAPGVATMRTRRRHDWSHCLKAIGAAAVVAPSSDAITPAMRLRPMRAIATARFAPNPFSDRPHRWSLRRRLLPDELHGAHEKGFM
jgi:hypothetical protein